MLTQSRFQTVFSALVVVTLLSGCGIFKKKSNDGESDVAAGTGLEGTAMPDSIPLVAGADWPEERRDLSAQLSTVLFGYDSTQILPGEMGKLSEVVAYLRSTPNSGVLVEGHCDERGSAEYNMALGERRALAVRAYLIGQGVEAHRVRTRSFGEEMPAAFGHNESAWRQNRRAEFKAYK